MSTLAPKTLAAILGAVIAVLALGGWFGLVAAQRSQSSSLETKASEAQLQLDVLEQSTRLQSTPKAGSKSGAKEKGKQKVTQADLLQLAFPSELGMPSILLQVQRLADGSGVTLEAFAPAMGLPLSGYQSIPIDVTVIGRYKNIQRFVHALRVQAGSSNGRVSAEGRLFAVETVGIVAAPEGLPDLTATILLDTFVYSGVFPAAATDATTPAEGTP
jgi:Tfp pilus assembly protein PilO